MQKNYFDSLPKSWSLIFIGQALQMRISWSPDEDANVQFKISLHLNMFLILNLVLMPTNDNGARSESTNHCVAPPLRAAEAALSATHK